MTFDDMTMTNAHQSGRRRWRRLSTWLRSLLALRLPPFGDMR